MVSKAAHRAKAQMDRFMSSVVEGNSTAQAIYLAMSIVAVGASIFATVAAVLAAMAA